MVKDILQSIYTEEENKVNELIQIDYNDKNEFSSNNQLFKVKIEILTFYIRNFL